MTSWQVEVEGLRAAVEAHVRDGVGIRAQARTANLSYRTLHRALLGNRISTEAFVRLCELYGPLKARRWRTEARPVEA